MFPVSQRAMANWFVGLDLRGKFPDLTELDAELIVASATFFVVRTALLVAERFQLRESFLESHGHVCSSPWG